MNIKEFYQLVRQEKDPDMDMLRQLQSLTTKHPYFQAGIFTYMKCLYLHYDSLFQVELQKLAPFILDRKALFYYIMNNEFKDFEKKVASKLDEDRTNILINAFFDSISNKNEEEEKFEQALENSGLISLDYFSYLETSNNQTKTNKTTKTDDILGNLENIEFDSFIETNSEYLLQEEIEDELTDEETSSNGESFKHQNLIDSFIEKAEKEEKNLIQIDKTNLPKEENIKEFLDPEMDGSSEDELEDDIFFTQTLANIYIKQKKFDRAYEIIKHLSLNYPEKNIYFADQLSFLEKIVKNSNKKNK